MENGQRTFSLFQINIFFTLDIYYDVGDDRWWDLVGNQLGWAAGREESNPANPQNLIWDQIEGKQIESKAQLEEDKLRKANMKNLKKVQTYYCATFRAWPDLLYNI